MNWSRIIETFYNFSFHKESYFRREAFLKSQSIKKPVDIHGNPIPWMNYAMLDFFKDRLNKNQSLFEYGSGFSTLYFANRLKRVTSIEYDESWFRKVEEDVASLDNAEVKFYALEDNYDTAIVHEGKEKQYELILVDGRRRVSCAKNAYPQLTPNGVLILDDSDREEYKEVFDFYTEKGFKSLTFTGIKPTSFRKHATTVFYRPDNCFNI